MKNEITIIFITFIPNINLLKKQINIFKEHFEILIVDMSPNEFRVTNYLQDLNKISIINKENKGQGFGHNTAIKEVKTKYGLYIDIDADIDIKKIKKLYRYANLLKKFSILIPNSNHKLKKNKIREITDCEASVMLFNIDVLKKEEMFDEKIFLYFEEGDLFKRLNKKFKMVYLIPKINVSHNQGTSSNPKVIKNLINLQQWHYLWSMFYVYKKNSNYFLSFINILPYITRDFIMLIIYILTLKFSHASKRYSRISGALSSMIGVPSFKRPKL